MGKEIGGGKKKKKKKRMLDMKEMLG